MTRTPAPEPTPPECDPERVEIVARAMWEADNPALAMFSPDELNALWAHNRNDRYRRLAAAAIAADPSPAEEAVNVEGDWIYPSRELHARDLTKSWADAAENAGCPASFVARMRSFVDVHDRNYRAALASPAPAPQGEEGQRCLTCNGRVWSVRHGKWVAQRETVGMVCQTCGTDYSR